MSMRVQVASVSDREKLVTEIWLGDVQVAEVSREQGQFDIEVYASQVSIPLADYVDALERAKEELMD